MRIHIIELVMSPNFAKKNPNDPHHRWMMLRSFTFTLYQVITTDGLEEPVLPIGRIPTHEEDADCNRWFRKLFKQDTIGPKDRPSPKLAPWLWARVLAVETFIDEQIEKQAPAPNYPQVPEALIDFLVNRWPTEMLSRWKEFTYDGTDVMYRGETVLFRPGRNHGPAQTTDEDHDPGDMTWQNVYNYTEMLARAMCKEVKMQLPIGQMPTADIDRHCNKWLKEFFASQDPQWMVEKNMPKAIAPWLAVRLLSSSVIAMGNLQTNPNHPTGDRLLDVIENLVIDRWPEYRRVWLGFRVKDGTPEFRADKLGDFEGLLKSKN